MVSRAIDKLCRSVLPPEFEQVKKRLPEIQQFLESNLPEPLNRAVTLLTLNQDEIVIAANSPLAANYLRLHQTELRQQLRESFGFEQALRIRSIPASMLRLGQPGEIPAPRSVNPQTVAALKRNAEWIEDEELKAALLSLADSLQAD